MLNKKEILNEIKKLMKFSSDTVNFAEAKSGENIVRVEGEDFVPGEMIMVVTEEGLIPAPDGEHILEDGRKLTVEAGKITEVELPEMGEEDKEEVEVEMAEITEEEKEEEKESAMKKMAETEEKIEEMGKKIMEMEEIIKEMVKAYGKVGEFSKSVETKIDEFIKNTPAEQHFSSLKSEWKTTIKENKTTELSSLDKIKELRSKK
jgi:hypothetical protein